MELVIDANVLISALIHAEGRTYDLIFNDRIKLFAPEYLKDEINKHKNEILSKSELIEKEFNLFLSLVSSRINFVPRKEFEEHLNEAEKITPDENDTEYFALALSKNFSIWSNDKKLKEQNKVKVYNTVEVIDLIK